MKKKYIRIILVVLILLVLLFPVKYRYKDGGTIEYKAILYSVTVWNVMGIDGLTEGTTIEILGIKLYDNKHETLYND